MNILLLLHSYNVLALCFGGIWFISRMGHQLTEIFYHFTKQVGSHNNSSDSQSEGAQS
jgi:hypothetical protein